MSLSSFQCCICSQIAGDESNDLLSKHLDSPGMYKRRIPMESEHFVVIPSVGPLCRGHVLICPKKHRRSLAALDGEELEEYQVFKENVCGKLRTTFQETIHAFEHGAATDSDRLICTIDHAHLHLLPTAREVSQAVLSALLWTELPGGLCNLREFTNGREYISYETPSGQFFVAQQARPFESQLMRQLFARVLNRPGSWNWRDEPRLRELEATYSTLAGVAAGIVT